MGRQVIANWKMHLSLQEAIEFCKALTNFYCKFKSKYANETNHLIIAAPTPYLAHLSHLFPHLTFAAQDVSIFEAYGTHTGEFSAHQLSSCRVNYCILGHLERRRDFGENDEIIKHKVNNCLDAGLVPIICLGRNMSFAKEFKEGCIIAYEPEGSIGTGVIPDHTQLEKVFGELKSMVAKSAGLIYGGSVNLQNLSTIKSINDIDGLLLGKAALNVEKLIEILNNW